jgi:hypothetical protein
MGIAATAVPVIQQQRSLSRKGRCTHEEIDHRNRSLGHRSIRSRHRRRADRRYPRLLGRERHRHNDHDAGSPRPGRRPGGAQDAPHADGTVTAINGDTLTISAGTDPTGTTEYTGVNTVVLTGATQYDAGHDSTGTISKSSIKVGSYVIVDGTLSSDGKTLTATSLSINAGGPVPGR